MRRGSKLKERMKQRRNDGGWSGQLDGTVYVKVADVTADSTLQHRARTHSNFIEEYAEILKSGNELAPIQVIRDENGTLWLWDGFHTLEAAKQAGVTEIKAQVSKGTKRKAWLNSLGANAKHGIRRSRIDLQNTVDSALSDPEIKYSLLNEDQQYNYNNIAKLCAVSRTTISNRWNDHHLPLILGEIDREVRGDSPVGVSLQEWLDIVASDLDAPAWLVKQRKIEIGFTSEPEPVASEASDENLTGGKVAPHQTTPVDLSDTQTSEKNLTGGKVAPHQATLVDVSDSDPDGQASEKNLTGGKVAPHQTTSVDVTDAQTSEKNLTGGKVAPHQTRSIDVSETPAEIINTSPSLSHVHPKSIVTVYDPTSNQLYDGEKLTTILTEYAHQKCGVKVIQAMRPDEGWSREAGQEIGRVFANATSNGTEKLKAVLVVLIEE